MWTGCSENFIRQRACGSLSYNALETAVGHSSAFRRYCRTPKHLLKPGCTGQPKRNRVVLNCTQGQTGKEKTAATKANKCTYVPATRQLLLVAAAQLSCGSVHRKTKGKVSSCGTGHARSDQHHVDNIDAVKKPTSLQCGAKRRVQLKHRPPQKYLSPSCFSG